MEYNINQETGVRFGYVPSDMIDPEVVVEMLQGAGVLNHSFIEWEREEVLRNENQWNENPDLAVHPERFEPNLDMYEPEEEIIEGSYEGVVYMSSYLGGSLNFFIMQSPHVTRVRLCSPCVPNAGDLTTPDVLGHDAYNIPESWVSDYWKKNI